MRTSVEVRKLGLLLHSVDPTPSQGRPSVGPCGRKMLPGTLLMFSAARGTAQQAHDEVIWAASPTKPHGGDDRENKTGDQANEKHDAENVDAVDLGFTAMFSITAGRGE